MIVPGKEQKRNSYVALTVLALVLLGLVFGAKLLSQEKTEKPSKIAVLLSGESRRERLSGLQHGMAQLGFREGKQLEYQIESAGENRKQLALLAQKIVNSDPHVIVVLGGLEADAIQQAQLSKQKETGRYIPVVFAGVASAAARGLYQGGQQLSYMTGVENLDAELSGKRLEYFKRLLPHLKRVGIVYEPGIIPSEQGLIFAQEVAPLLDLEILKYPVRSVDDLAALETLLQPGACDGLLLMPSFIIESALETFYRLSLNQKIPVFGLRVKEASAYYFASFGPNVYHQGQQAARLVAKIIKQGSLEDIPVETPDRVELVINIDIADQLGITLTPEQLHYADSLAGRSVR